MTSGNKADNKADNKAIYRAYGLIIESDIEIPELLPASGPADIKISLGQAPQNLRKPTGRFSGCQLSNNELLFKIEGIGRYYVREGMEIVVEPDSCADADSVRPYILGTAFGALLLQRGMLPVHGSAVVINGKCVIFTGIPGAGKSTLSLALRKSGYTFLADDISVIGIDEKGIPVVQPGYPQQKLCRDAIRNMGEEEKLFTLIDVKRDKFAVPVREGFPDFPAELATICELKAENCSGVDIKHISGTEKLRILMKNIFRVEMLRWFGTDGKFFEVCMKIASQTDFFRMIRPAGEFSVKDQIMLMKENGIILP